MPEMKLSLWRVITTDYTIFNCLVFPIISLIVTVITAGNPLLIGVLTIVSLSSMVIASIRFIRILTIINENQIADGLVTGIDLNTKRGTIYIDYVYREVRFHSCQYVIRTKYSALYKPGDRIRMLVDWNDPRKALIADLYTDTIETQ